MINLIIKVLDTISRVIGQLQINISKFYDNKLSIRNKTLLLEFHPYDLVMERSTKSEMDKKLDSKGDTWGVKDVYGPQGRYVVGVVIGYEGFHKDLPKKIKVAFLNPDNFNLPVIVLKDPQDLYLVLSSMSALDSQLKYQRQLTKFAEDLEGVLKGTDLASEISPSNKEDDEDDNGGGFYH
jgi:hypothetical protein